MTPEELRAKVDTIVIVMMENRSFDDVLGHLCLPDCGGRHDVEGLPLLDDPSYLNVSRNGTASGPFIARDDDPLMSDLPHERDDVSTRAVEQFTEAQGHDVVVKKFAEIGHRLATK